MYVIWQKRKREHNAGRNKIGDVRLTPIIAQSKRVNGKPRQEYIACLQSIIESHINEKTAVGFWRAVEERLARLTNRIPQEDMEKIRAALDKVVPQPEPEYAKKHEDEAQAYVDATVAMLTPESEWEQDANRKLHAFRKSSETAQACADCGEPMEEVYRERRTFGHGFMGGRRWAVGVLCKKCVGEPWHFTRHSPCKTCGREVHMSYSLTAYPAFCSTRCGQAHYRKAKLSTRST